MDTKNRTTQKQIVLEHLLEFGCITPNEAIYKYKITRLADVIYKLKKDGYSIREDDMWSTNSVTGNKCKYAMYSMQRAV